jgi:hypothetical protein
MGMFRMVLVSALLSCVMANPSLESRESPPILQSTSVTISTNLLPAQLTYEWTWEARSSTGVPYAQIISGPEGLRLLISQPPPNIGFWGVNLSGVDQLTNTIPINSNNLGIVGFIEANTRYLSSCKIDVRNPTVIVSNSANGQTETISAQVQCSTPYQA